MSEQNTSGRSSPSSAGTDARPTERSSGQTGRTEYRRQVPHITQEPIDDIETEYVMPNRYAAADQTSGTQHKHMGVATSEPEYLPRTGPQVRQRTEQETLTQGGGRHTAGRQSGRKGDSLDYRYLETPRSGKSIFISREERRRKRNRRIAAVVAVAAVVVIVVCLVVFL